MLVETLTLREQWLELWLELSADVKEFLKDSRKDYITSLIL